MPTHSAENEVWEALVALLRRGQEGSFVVIEERHTKKYVQFGMGPRLALDVPCVALTPKEAERASHFFKQFGAEVPKEYASRNPATNRTQHGATFTHDFGRDTRGAAKAALDALAVIYDFPSPIEVHIKES